MQNINLMHYIDQKFNVIVIKTAHRRSDLLKTFVSQEIFASIGLRKNLFQKSQNFQSGLVFSHFLKSMLP